MAFSYASLFLGYFEANALENAPFQPHTWLQYIDDIFYDLDHFALTLQLKNIKPTS